MNSKAITKNKEEWLTHFLGQYHYIMHGLNFVVLNIKRLMFCSIE